MRSRSADGWSADGWPHLRVAADRSRDGSRSEQRSIGGGQQPIGGGADRRRAGAGEFKQPQRATVDTARMYEPRESTPGTVGVGARGDGERRAAPGKSTRTARLKGGPLGAPAGADVVGGTEVSGGAYGGPTPIGSGMPALDDPFGLHLPTTGTTFVGDDGAPPTDMFADQRAALADELERLIARAEWPALRPEARGAAAPGADGRAQARRRGEMPDLTGTGSVASMDSLVRGLRAIRNAWDGATSEERAGHLEQVVAELLTAADVPPAKIVVKKDWRAPASFNFRGWEIFVRASLLTPIQLTDAAACELADVLAHEARHAEQYFLAARWLAGKGATADEIVATIVDLPRPTAEAAVARGVRGLSGPAMALASSMQQALGPDHQRHVQEANDTGYDELAASRDRGRAVLSRLRARPATASLEDGRAACHELEVAIAEVLRKYRVYRHSPYELDGHEAGAGAVAAFEASR